MSTQCNIAIKESDGTVTGTSVHFDGYPENMIPSILNYISQRTVTSLIVEITQAITQGGFRTFVYRNADFDLWHDDITTRQYRPGHFHDLVTEDNAFDDVPYTYIIDRAQAKILHYARDYTLGQMMLVHSERLPADCV